MRRAVAVLILAMWPIGAVGGICFELPPKVWFTPQKLHNKTKFAASGKREKIEWSYSRDIVPVRIEKLQAWLLNHNNWKDPEKTDIEVKSIENSSVFILREIEVSLNIFLFISASWTEQWAFHLQKGTERKPVDLLAAYQKIRGTALERLCGYVNLKKISPKRTQVSFYEEAISNHYGASDMVEMHQEFMDEVRVLEKRIN